MSRAALFRFLIVATALWPVRARGAAPELTPSSVRAFADRVVPSRMADAHVPGAIFVVVAHGEVVLAAGYGLANVEAKIAVDPRRTLFRIGSVSKCVTAAAIVQLAARGQVDLEEDLRPLLAGLGVRPRFDRPITAVHLLTHSSGFDVTDIGDAARTAERAMPLETFLRDHMTAQVAPPGEIFRYTNHGYALLGYLAEVRAHRPFAAVVEETVFAPLGMTSSTFEQPAPAALRERVAVGYEWSKGALHPLPMDYSNVAPADAMLTNAIDIAAFMNALLARTGTGTVAGADSLARMRATAFAADPSLPGRSLGFEEELAGAHREIRGRRRLLTHTGGQLGFTSEILLWPDRELGLFMVQNLRDYRVRAAVFDELLSTFFPGEPDDPVVPARVEAARLVLHAGRYQRLPDPVSTLESLGDLLAPAVLEVSSTGASIQIEGMPKLVPLSATAFVSRDGKVQVGLSGPRLYLGEQVYLRIAWYQSYALQRALLLAAITLSCLGIPAWPLSRALRRRHIPETAAEARSGRLAAAACTVNVAWVALVAAGLANGIRDGGFDYGLPPSLEAALWLALLPVLGAIAMVLAAVDAWRAPRWTWPLRAALTATAAASLVLVAIAYRWHLVGLP